MEHDPPGRVPQATPAPLLNISCPHMQPTMASAFCDQPHQTMGFFYGTFQTINTRERSGVNSHVPSFSFNNDQSWPILFGHPCLLPLPGLDYSEVNPRHHSISSLDSSVRISRLAFKNKQCSLQPHMDEKHNQSTIVLSTPLLKVNKTVVF